VDKFLQGYDINFIPTLSLMHQMPLNTTSISGYTQISPIGQGLHMDDQLFNAIRKVKVQYLAEGFSILGIFGSFARDEADEYSDLDILYEFQEHYYDLYPGWSAYARLEEIKDELTVILGRRVDLAGRNALDVIAQKHILPEVRYV
jgi:predicted nucleotidyltransferase